MSLDNLVTRFARNNDSSNPYLFLAKCGSGFIDIRPESGFYGEDEDDEPKTEEKSEDVLDLDESTEGETVVSDETEE